MNERYSPQHPSHVREQSQSQYESIGVGYANARRALYQYTVPPWEKGAREPYDIWEDMADHLNPENATKIIDLGTNDGLFHTVLRKKGFGGKYIGVDNEGKDLPVVEYISSLGYPNSDTEFVEGDAEHLHEIFPENSTPNSVAAFLGYHVSKPSRMLSGLHWILEPGGKAIVASRSATNQLDTWTKVGHIAHSSGFAFPQEIYVNEAGERRFISGVPIDNISVYSHFDIDRTRRSLKQSRKFKVIEEKVQDSVLWIPPSEVGWYDYSTALESLLPYTVNIKTGERPKEDDLETMYNYIHGFWRQYFINQSVKNMEDFNLPMPCYLSHASQGFFVVEAIK